ncbi:glycosyltransferase family 2 protein [Photobacterium carnosum]|uniref:glycosyltransferase family 2 protein n=1 Tax=Photobacterium carnosum TaxID=2023717 RepID=UPI001E5659C5|nr:glycosyltransferase family 2 protein [Photobacterium carnosum]MCD9539148.1 glycosyltransferase [Photobacterium carnosum]MCF2163636.1 glycosyltransferase [Photobacterium carnosum]
MRKVSIIVPVYNLEKYIEKCILSIIDQNYSLWELILINDGSIDDSEAIIQRYSEKDERIKFKTIKNAGVSNARSEGVKLSTGNYIMFVDGDDTIDIDCISNLMLELIKNKVDLVVSGYKRILLNGKIIEKPYKSGMLTSEDFLSKMLNFEIEGSPCSRIYKKEIFKYNDIELDRDIFFKEDLIMNIRYCSRIEKIYISSLTPYNYYEREGSTMTIPRTVSYDIKFAKVLESVVKNSPLNGNKKVLQSLNTHNVSSSVYSAYYQIKNKSHFNIGDLISFLDERINNTSNLKNKYKIFYMVLKYLKR